MPDLRTGQRVRVKLPDDVAGWFYPEGSEWTGSVLAVNGDSVDVQDDNGEVELVDSEYVEPVDA